jgi:hypothetical protein
MRTKSIRFNRFSAERRPCWTRSKTVFEIFTMINITILILLSVALMYVNAVDDCGMNADCTTCNAAPGYCGA